MEEDRKKELGDRKKTIDDLKEKLESIKKKTDEYANNESNKDKNENKNLDKTIMVPVTSKDKKKNLKDKNKDQEKNKKDIKTTGKIKNDKIKDEKTNDLSFDKEKEDRRKKREERLREKKEKEELKKEEIKKEKQNKKKKEENLPFKKLSGGGKALYIIKRLFVLFVFLLIVLCGLLFGYIYGLFGNDSGVEKLLAKEAEETTVVYDRDGNELARLSEEERRSVIKLNEMGEYIPKAYIAIEDQRFFSHSGIDLKRTASATFNYIFRKNANYGGSTITQQLVKNISKDDEKTAARKLREFSRALQIEQRISKDEILELYLNLIYVGGENVYGMALGSDYYFSKKPKDLTLEEAAFLAGINHSPGRYNPFLPKGFHIDDKGEKIIDNKEENDSYNDMHSKINARTKTVLDKMLELEKISKEEYDKAVEALNKGLKFAKGTLAYSTSEYSYLTDAAIDEAIDIIAEKEKVDKKVAKLIVYKNGYHIYTTQDSKIQKLVEDHMRTTQYTILSSKYKDENGKPYKTQATTTILDHKTGQIVAAVGGMEDQVRLKRGDWNRVTRTLRQPGSAIKPIIVTAPGLESGKITLGHTFDDTPYEKNGWRPQNFSGGYMGRLTIRKALVKSLNIPQIRQLEVIGPKYATDFLRKMDFDIDPADDNNLAISLGGLTKGVSNVNMVSAYGMIANDGEYIKPTFVLKIEDKTRDVIYKSNPEKKRVLSEGNAFLLKDVLKDSTNPGEIIARGKMPNIDVAGKTGTTDAYNDSYCCLLSNYYTAATWYGFDKQESFQGGRGYFNHAMDLLIPIFKEIHAGKPASQFVKPENVEKETVLFNEFKKAPAGLKEGTLTEWFVKGTGPTEESHDYISVKVCKRTGKLATPECDDVEEKVFRKGQEPTEYCDCKKVKEAENKKAKEELDKVISVFNSIGSVSSASTSQLRNAKKLYDGLSEGAKAKVSEGMKAKYNEIVAQLEKEDNRKNQYEANKVMRLIDDIPSITTSNVSYAKIKVRTARSEYNSLNSSAKKLVTNYNKLVKAEADVKEKDK